MTKLNQEYASIPASHPRELTWIDRAVPPEAGVGLVLAPIGTTENAYYVWWQPNFWNKTVRHAFVLPGASSSLAQAFASTLRPDLAHGRLTGLDGVNYLAKLTADARFGVRAAVVAAAGGVTLYRLPAGAPLVYATHGVDEIGTLVLAAHPFIRIFGSGTATRTEHLGLTVQVTPPESGCPCRLLAGARDRGVRLPTATPAVGPLVQLARTVTVPPHGEHVDLPLTVRGENGAPGNHRATLSAWTSASSAAPAPVDASWWRRRPLGETTASRRPRPGGSLPPIGCGSCGSDGRSSTGSPPLLWVRQLWQGGIVVQWGGAAVQAQWTTLPRTRP